MELNARQRGALEAICNTFAPGDNGFPSAVELGVPDALVAAIDRNPREAERKQVAQLLNLWDTRGLTALAGGGFSRFTTLPQERREQVLRAWADSRMPQRRAAFQALRRGTLLFYWMLPGGDGARNPAWDLIGFPGPLGPPESPPPKPLQPLQLVGDTELECDVCVVGSGAGGGTAAAVLAESGLDVVVLEAGGYYDDADFDGSEAKALTRYYAAAPQGSHDQSVGLVAGSCLGGGTVVNYTTSFRTPDDVREEWAGHGVPAFSGEEYGASLEAVCRRLGVNQEHNSPSTRDQKLQEGCAKLGWHVDRMPRNVDGCDQGKVCGYCGLGCQLGAKRSVTKTWLVDAHNQGARLIVDAIAERVIIEGGAARGVEARTPAGSLQVRARAVVSACGAIQTPALLKRSGLGNRNIGRHLRLHPVTVVWGVYDEELRPWEGTMQALYSDEHRHLDSGYGVKYETGSLQPHLFLPFAPWRSGRHHQELMQALSHTTPVGIILRDRDGGEVRVGRDGEPVVRYRLSRYDTGHLRKGIAGAARIHEAAGARRIYSSHAKWVAYEPNGGAAGLERFLAGCDAAGYGPGQCHFGSFHIMGSARMGGSPATSACRPSGETWDVRDLYICDGSTFPTASGVNPMISIEAIAHMNARNLASTLS